MNPDKKNSWLMAGALALLTLAIFWPVTRHEFINLDDPVYVTKDAHVRNGVNWENIKWVFTETHANFWHPLTTLSHMLDCQFYGLKPAGHHLTGLLFHVASVVVLFLVLHRMTGAKWRSGMVAALFALHPLHVESVAWVAERKDVVSTFFWMLTMWAYVRYAEGKNPKPGSQNPKLKNQHSTSNAQRSTFNYSLTLIFFTLGLMAKPMLVTLPFVLLLLDFWPLRRVMGGEWQVTRKEIQKLVVEKIPLFILAAVFMAIALEAQKHGGAIMTSDRVPYSSRFQNAAISYCTYLAKTFWPSGLSVFYPYPPRFAPALIGVSALVLIGITAFVGKARRFPYLAVGWFWYLGTLIPVIGFVQVGSHAMADRYTYVPLIGFFIALIWGICELAARWANRKFILSSLGVLALLGCVIITSLQLKHWENSGKLFEHALAVTERNPVAHVQLSAYAIMKGDVATADLHARQALQMFPNNRIAHRMMGLVFEAQKNWPEAAEHFSQTLAATPNDVEALYGFGNALFHLGRNAEAIASFSKVITLLPGDAAPHNNLGNVLLAEGRLDDAIAEYAEALRLKPSYTDARYNLAFAYVKQERFAEALPHFALIVKESPNDAQAHYFLGMALSRSGQAGAAIAQFQEAIRLAPEQAVAISATTELAFIFSAHPDAAVRNEAEAVRLAERAVAVTQAQEPWILTVLARAYAATGRFDEAMATAEKIKAMAANKNSVETAEKDLALYRNHQPYRNEAWAKSNR